MDLHTDNPHAGVIPSSGRFHSLDALRITAMFLVILFHASIPYMKPAYFFWPALDTAKNTFFGHFASATLAVCLPAFFLLTGFFASMLVKKRGFAGFVKNRTRRIVIPLAIGAVAILPLLQIITIVAARTMSPAEASQFDRVGIEWALCKMRISQFLSTGLFIKTFRWWHLWFLWYLIIYYAIYLAVRPLIKPVLATGLPDHFFAWIIRSPLKPIVLAIPTVILLSPMTTLGVETPSRVEPMPRILVYYMLFYAFGHMLHRQKHLLAECGKGWKTHLSLAFMLALPALIYFRSQSFVYGSSGHGYRLAALVCNSMFIWLTVFGLLGLYQRYFDYHSPTVQYMSEASYFCYLVHLPPLILLQLLTKDVPLPAWFKFLVIFGVLMPLLVLAHHFLVRKKFFKRAAVRVFSN